MATAGFGMPSPNLRSVGWRWSNGPACPRSPRWTPMGLGVEPGRGGWGLLPQPGSPLESDPGAGPRVCGRTPGNRKDRLRGEGLAQSQPGRRLWVPVPDPCGPDAAQDSSSPHPCSTCSPPRASWDKESELTCAECHLAPDNPGPLGNQVATQSPHLCNGADAGPPSGVSEK